MPGFPYRLARPFRSETRIPAPGHPPVRAFFLRPYQPGRKIANALYTYRRGGQAFGADPALLGLRPLRFRRYAAWPITSSPRRRSPPCRSGAAASSSRCAASSASAATMPSMRSRWAATRPASRPSTSPSRLDALVVGGADMPYPPAVQVAAPRDGAGRGHRHRRRRHQGGGRAGPCLGLLRRPRHDPPRPAERGQEDRPPLGHGQGLRPLRADGRRSSRPRASTPRAARSS